MSGSGLIMGLPFSIICTRSQAVLRVIITEMACEIFQLFFNSKRFLLMSVYCGVASVNM